MKQVLVILVVAFLSGTLFAQEKLTLEQCIAIALENNNALQTEKNNNKAAEYGVLGGYSGILPTIDISSGISHGFASESETFREVQNTDSNNVKSFSYSRVVNPQTEWDDYSMSIAVNQNIFDGFAWYNQIRRGYTEKTISNQNLKDRTNTTIKNIQNYFYNLIKQMKLYEVNKIAVSRSESQLELTEKMFELGSKAKLDVYQAKVNLGSDKITMLTQENIVGNAKRLLNISMGRNPDTPLEIKTLDFGYANVSSIEQMREIAEENQPLIKRNEAQVESNSISTYLAYSQYYPRLSAFFRYRRSSGFEIEKLYSDFDLNYSRQLGINLSWNLFNGLSDHVNIQKAKIAEKNAMLAMEDYKRQMDSRILSLADDYNSYKEIIAINEENLDASKEELRLAEERYRIGAGTSLEVREAQVKLTRAEQTLIAAQYNALTTLADLDYELGISQQKILE